MSPSYFAGLAGHPRDDIIDRTRDAPSGLQTTKATTLCPQILLRLRGAHGNRVCPLLRDPFRRRMAMHRRASYFSSIAIRRTMVPCQWIRLPGAAPDPVPALSHVHYHLVVIRAMCLPKHWSKPAILSTGVCSAAATVQRLRFSVMIIGPSSAEQLLVKPERRPQNPPRAI